MTPAGALAVSTVAFDGHPLEAAFDEIAALGLRRVEPAFIKGYTAFDESTFSDAVAARLARSIAARGLAVQAVSAHLDLSAPGAEAMLDRRIAFAAALGAGALITNSGPRSRRADILALLRRARPALAAAGVTLAIENPGHGMGDLFGTGAEGAALAEALGDARIGLNVDVGNLVTYGPDHGPDTSPGPGLTAALPQAVHAHLKDVAEVGPDWRFVPLGEGQVDWAATAQALAAPGLPVAIELPLRLTRPGRGDPQRAADPVPLPMIRDAIRRSVEHWSRFAPGGSGTPA